LLPLGSLVYLLFCVSKRGWSWEKFTAEANAGKGLKIQNWMRFYMTWILPVIVVIIFILGIKDKFFG
ncbi:MAG TPA: sodium-dependent transporter, partial [Lachnospiraceae bacterium]|nr:sodium-dependent transporter [Lachnospiraceae bacterium]